MKRKLAWVVGTKGFSGCSTREMPVAKNSRPCPWRRRANASSSSPNTAEVLTPAFSKTAPDSITRVRPPPPPARVHTSSRKRPRPSSASRAAQISSWSFSTKACISAWSLGSRSWSTLNSVYRAVELRQLDVAELGLELVEIVLHRQQQSLHVLEIGRASCRERV